MRRLVTVTALALALHGCAKPGITLAPQRPIDVKAQKWFSVHVKTAGAGCEFTIHPEADEGQGEVKVQRRWYVAWLFVNTCANARGETPRIEFFYRPTGTEEKNQSTMKQPVRWRVQTAGVLLGRVSPRGNAKECKADPDAPCGRYGYTIHVGKFSKDPEFEIIIF